MSLERTRLSGPRRVAPTCTFDQKYITYHSPAPGKGLLCANPTTAVRGQLAEAKHSTGRAPRSQERQDLRQKQRQQLRQQRQRPLDETRCRTESSGRRRRRCGFLQRLGDSRRLRQVMNITDTFTDTFTDTVADGRGGAGEVWHAAGGSRTHLGAQGTADPGKA